MFHFGLQVQIEGEEAQRLSKRRLERERARRDATADMSEDLSEGEKGEAIGDLSVHGDSSRGRMPRISSVDAIEFWTSQFKDKKLYIVLISIHGLIRGEDMELGRDSDTGGQVKYVVELARALGSMPGVYRVDLLTRQISAPDVDWSYGEPTEMLTSRSSDSFMHEMGESSGAYIIRIPFGPRDKYIPKEFLWPHIQEFVDGALGHVLQMSKVLGEQIGGGQPIWPVAIHGHYADAGDSAALLSGALNVPMLFTGHSLGRDKLDQLLKQGRQTREEINVTYKIMRRIEAEEISLDASEIVITSTRQEIEEQWRLYDGFDVVLERKLRARIKRGVSCYGRYMPRMVVICYLALSGATYINWQSIPPGMEFNHITIHDGDVDGESEGADENSAVLDPPIWSEVGLGVFINPAFIEPFGLTLIEVLDNGMLVDPHDQHAIADALYKLVSDKQLWARCRQNGLKNIHQFSWPEHCKTYLSKIASCRPRHPQWRRSEEGIEDSEPDSPNDSLRDIKDISLNLKLSLDGEKGEDGSAIGKALVSEDVTANGKSNLENDIVKLSKGVMSTTQKDGSSERTDNYSSKLPMLRRRKYIFVIALDSVSDADLIGIIKSIFEASSGDMMSGSIGFILSTRLTILEIHSLLMTGGIPATDFDAFICNSGSDVYYPSSSSDDLLYPYELPYALDIDYHSQIEYRWGGEGLRKTLVRWAASIADKKGESEEQVVVEDVERSSTYCYAFQVPPIKELRKHMRIQALRCHVLYSHDGSKLHVIPVLASRSQALRYK
ncbi:hypothetical protein BHM03_00031201 [Ensete ventricosum]|nr:hypothetical protein BHM03_00031201 [Ensete ventricosum]